MGSNKYLVMTLPDHKNIAAAEIFTKSTKWVEQRNHNFLENRCRSKVVTLTTKQHEDMKTYAGCFPYVSKLLMREGSELRLQHIQDKSNYMSCTLSLAFFIKKKVISLYNMYWNYFSSLPWHQVSRRRSSSQEKQTSNKTSCQVQNRLKPSRGF